MKKLLIIPLSSYLCCGAQKHLIKRPVPAIAENLLKRVRLYFLIPPFKHVSYVYILATLRKTKALPHTAGEPSFRPFCLSYINNGIPCRKAQIKQGFVAPFFVRFCSQTGKKTEKTAPLPSSLSTAIVPLCS